MSNMINGEDSFRSSNNIQDVAGQEMFKYNFDDEFFNYDMIEGYVTNDDILELTEDQQEASDAFLRELEKESLPYYKDSEDDY